MHFLGKTPVFVLGEETLLFAGEDGDARRHPCRRHPGERLRRRARRHRRRRRHADGDRRSGEPRVIATDDKKRWIDQVALAPDGAVAWSAGKTAHVLTGRARRAASRRPRPSPGLPSRPRACGSPSRITTAPRSGFPTPPAPPQKLEWKGSHLGVAFSPDGQFLVTAMQEPTLHGWRLADAKHMRMSGYSARVRSLGWTADGEYLATSGSEQLILWPFDGKDGPMGRQPKLHGAVAARVAVVACHPRQPVVAVGYADGRCCWCASTTARSSRSWPRAPARSARSAGTPRPAARFRHRSGRSRRFVVLIAAVFRPNNSAAVQLACYTFMELSGLSTVACCHSIAHGDRNNDQPIHRPPPSARRGDGLALAVAGVSVPVVAGALTPAMRAGLRRIPGRARAYGHWVRHARFGEVWVPDDVPPDWRPYEYGHWVYTDDWGWYWVSDDEEDDWGWVVYHYGRWAMTAHRLVLGAGRRMGAGLGRLALWRRLCRLGAAAARRDDRR